MKIRNGFVSNSSSSSFVVAFDKKPETVEELKKLLFGDEEVYGNPYRHGNEPRGWTAQQVAETVFHDLKDQSPMTVDEVREEFNSGHLSGSPDFPFGCFETGKEEEGRKRWKEWEERNKAFCDSKADFFMSEYKGKQFFRFSYSDNDGAYYSALEHGDLFEKLPHFQISHH